MSVKKRIVTLPHGRNGIIYSGSSLRSAWFSGDSPIKKSVKVYTSNHNIPKWQNNAGSHTLASQGAGGLTNTDGLFYRGTTQSSKMVFKVVSNTNQTTWHKSFLVGDSNNSSWLCNVCGLWGFVDSLSSSGGRDPVGWLDQIIGTYKSPSGNTFNVPYTVQKGDYAFGRQLAPFNTEQHFGFLASSSDSDKIMRDKWMLWGFYFQVGVRRKGKGTADDTMTVALSSLTPQINKNYSTWNKENTKRLIVPQRRSWGDAQKAYKIILNH